LSLCDLGGGGSLGGSGSLLGGHFML
jgi:hypothetical protein